MGRMVANKGNGECISTDDPLTVSPMPSDIVKLKSGAELQCVNTAELADAVEVISNVRINGNPVVVVKSEIPKSSGAPSDAIKGVNSPPPANNRCIFKSASGTVRAGGHFLIRHRDVTSQNAGNCAGAVKLKEAFSLDGSGIELAPGMTPEQEEAVVADLEKLAERPRTGELLDTIREEYQKHGHKIIVSANSYNSTFHYFKASPIQPWEMQTIPLNDSLSQIYGENQNCCNKVGVNSWIQFNPTESMDMISPELWLAHELVHGLHLGNGTEVQGTSIGKMPDGSPALQATNNSELQAMGLGEYSDERLTEAKFMEERGMPVKTSHGDKQGDFPYNPKKESIAPVAFATGKNGEHFVYCNR